MCHIAQTFSEYDQASDFRSAIIKFHSFFSFLSVHRYPTIWFMRDPANFPWILLRGADRYD